MIINHTNYLPTYLTKPLRITIVKRSVGENPLKKVVEKCVGKGCEEFATSIPNNQKNVPTAQGNNAAAQLQVKETSVPTTEIVKPLAPLPQSGTTSQVQNMLYPKVPSFKDHEYALDNPGVKYALQKASNEKFDSDQEALKLAHKMGANNTTTSKSDSTTTTTTQTTSANMKVLDNSDKNLSKYNEVKQTTSNIPGNKVSPNNLSLQSHAAVSVGNFKTGPLGTSNPVSKTTLIPENTQTVPHTHTRGMVSMHVGKFRPHRSPRLKDPVTASNDNTPLIMGDQSGEHKVVVAAVCSKEGCSITNCATGTAETNPCSEPAEYHQQSIREHSFIVHEYVGTLTHQKPPHLEVQEVDPVIDCNGDTRSQSVTKEAGLTPVDPISFHEKEDKTLYVQDNARTEALIKAMPLESVLNQK